MMGDLGLPGWGARATYPLRPAQARAVAEFEARGRLGLAYPPGYGKSRIMLTALRWSDAAHVLWVAPKRVAELALPEEVAKWGFDARQFRLLTSADFGREARYDFDGRRDGLQFADRKATKAHIMALAAHHRVLVASFDFVEALAQALGATRLFDLLVVDEASFVKTRSAKRFKAVNHFGKGAKQMIAATGTPHTAKVDELWALAFLIDHGERLGRTLTEFRERYMILDRNGFSWSVRSDAHLAEIRDLFAELWIAPTECELLQMPELTLVDVKVPLPATTARAATAFMKGRLGQLRDGQTVLPPAVAAGLNKALQACDGFVYADSGTVREHGAKYDALDALLAEGIDGGVLLFFRYQEQAAVLAKRLGADVRFVTEPGAIEAWQRGEFKVLAGHPASMGHGLNLQGNASTMIFLGLPWSLEQYLQSIGRLHRSGQTKPVIVHRIVADHPVELAVLDSLENKATLLQALLTRLGETT